MYGTILLSLFVVDVEYELLVGLVPTLMKVDFQSLRTPRLDYASQEVIPKTKIKQLASCAIHYGLDFGLVARFLGGEYTGTSRDITATLSEIAPHVESDNLNQIRRVHYQGCPSKIFLKRAEKIR